MSDDASATYRGYRKQALYILHRILTDRNSESVVYRPEGAEDLAILDSQMSIAEAIQVKDHKAGLAVSHLKPMSKSGFFARLKNRTQDNPNCTTKIASFGALGNELRGAIDGRDPHRKAVLDKLEQNPEFSAETVEQMLDALKGNILHPNEDELTKSVLDALRGTCVGGDVERSAELLMYWIFLASENRDHLTRDGLLAKLQSIGTYLAELRDFSTEWGTTLSCPERIVLSADDAHRWRDEYRKGTQARWEHILAEADCPRPERLDEIHRKLQSAPATIIRGASGQGKSTLGWRYLYDFVADGLRFHVQLVEGRRHAKKIASALCSHVQRLNLQAVAFVDVSPSDKGWSELVGDLVAGGIKVLVAVREEDFQRAKIASGDFVATQVILDRITREEAKPIFELIRREDSPGDFEEIWARFGAEDGGPMLEFTHLISEGEALDSRIASQVARLQTDAVNNREGVGNSHLELLALSAIANEAGARLSLKRAFDHLEIGAISGVLKVLENEFLIRVQTFEDESLISGLHALRSRAIVKSLFFESPESWIHYSGRVLPLLVDDDIENFLLFVFSERPANSEEIFQQICGLALRSWSQAGGIVKALLWEGVNRYEILNEPRIAKAITKYQSGWFVACDSFLATERNPIHELVDESDRSTDIELIELSPKSETFDLFKAWADETDPPPAPTRSSDWVGCGDVAFWIGHVNSRGLLRNEIERILPSPLPDKISLETLGAYISGREMLGDAPYYQWHDKHQNVLTKRLLDDTRSLHISDNGEHIKVYFMLKLEGELADDWNEQSMSRIRFLRSIFSHREVFGSQAIGLEVFAEIIEQDPSYKKISRETLIPERATEINALFTGLVSYRRLRADSWREYSEAVVAFRMAVTDCFRKLHKAWNKQLSESHPRKASIGLLPGKEIDTTMELSKLPMYPRSAVDRLGFLSEQKQQKEGAQVSPLHQALLRFKPWGDSFRDYRSGVEMVLQQATYLSTLLVLERSGQPVNEEEDKSGRLTLLNLSAAWEALPAMQREFRERFGCFVKLKQLDELDRFEQINFRHLWSAAFAVHSDRGLVHRNSVLHTEKLTTDRRNQFLDRLRDALQNLSGEDGEITVREVLWELDGKNHLCIVCDHYRLDSMDETSAAVVRAIRVTAQSLNLRNLEWSPHVVEWPMIAIVNLVGGKAVAPACASIATLTFFAGSDPFVPKPHHTMPLPVSSGSFEEAGFSVWDNPLITDSILFQTAVQKFVLINLQFPDLAQLYVDENLQESEAERFLAQFTQDVRDSLTEAQRSHAKLVQTVSVLDSPKKADWLFQLSTQGKILLFELDEQANVRIDFDSFQVWSEEFESAMGALQGVTFEVIQYAIDKERDGEN